MNRVTSTGGTDGYQIVAHELPYMADPGVAYKDDDVTITHFPAAHDRDGSISYRLEFNGKSVVFSGDTKPTDWMLPHGKGVDVLIHEMALSVNDWVEHQAGLHPGDDNYAGGLRPDAGSAGQLAHPAKALGQTFAVCKPRLGVITHCFFNQDIFINAVDGVRGSTAARWHGRSTPWCSTCDRASRSSSARRSSRTSAGISAPRTIRADEVAQSKFDGPYAQFSDYTMRHILPAYKR